VLSRGNKKLMNSETNRMDGVFMIDKEKTGNFKFLGKKDVGWVDYLF
jgi:hypothetical protein